MTIRLLTGDVVDCLDAIDNNTIDLTITSPPYKVEDGYSVELMGKVAKKLYQKVKPGSLFFLNFGHLADDKFRPFECCKIFIDNGFLLNDTITWVKNHYKPIQGNKRVNNLTEFIFLLYKEVAPCIDRLSIGIPYIDKSNISRFKTEGDKKCRGNVWLINYPTQNKHVKDKLHPHAFPPELVEKCILLSGLKKGVVLDIFAGSGTTLKVATKMGLDSIGIDRNKIVL